MYSPARRRAAGPKARPFCLAKRAKGKAASGRTARKAKPPRTFGRDAGRSWGSGSREATDESGFYRLRLGAVLDPGDIGIQSVLAFRAILTVLLPQLASFLFFLLTLDALSLARPLSYR